MACCGNLTKAGWLRLVIVQATLLCMVQIYAGMFAHSLALLSDAVHGVVDVFTYGLAYLAEQLKTSSVVGKRNQKLARVVDLAGFFTSLAFIGLASIYVTDAACDRLSAQQLEKVAGHQALLEVSHPAKAGEGVNGKVMLAFSVVATVSNLVLAGLYTEEETTGKRRKASVLQKAHSFFPHIHGPQCGHEVGELGQPGEQINLNILMQWVHVVMDGLRGLVMLICSVLICLGWIEAQTTDAVLSIAVCAMVVLGSLGLVPRAYAQLRAVMDAPPDAEPIVEAEPLLKSTA